MLVNICMITYNHQEYISESIESILRQATNFSIQLIIGEDHSTDRTKEICEGYAVRFPDKITLITSDGNVGMSKNFLRTYKACNGKYIAFCEGDDFWTDPNKLQKQVDFLETNPAYSGCFHNVTMMEQRNGENREWTLHKSLPKDTFITEDILGPWFIPSPSFVFVNYTDFVLPDWFFDCQYGDLPFMLLLTLRGDIKYMDEVMGVYRLHNTGASSLHKAYDKIMVMVYIYASFDIYTKYTYHDVIRKAVMYEIERHTPTKEIIQTKITDTRFAAIKKLFIK